MIAPVPNLSNIDRYIDIGHKDINWYHRCELMFRNLFGDEDLELVTKLFAATSINSTLKSNITLFRKAYFEAKNNMPVGSAGSKGYLPCMQMQIERVRAGLPLSGRKINNFQRAMTGDRSAVVVDTWLCRAFDMDVKRTLKSGRQAGMEKSCSPTRKIYDTIEYLVCKKAFELFLEPRQVSSMIWAGTRIFHNGDRETEYTNIVQAKLLNLFNVI